MKRKKSIIITIAVLFHLSLIVIAAANVTSASVKSEAVVQAIALNE